MKKLAFAAFLLIPVAARAETQNSYTLPALGDIYNECLLHRVEERAKLMETADKNRKLEAQVASLQKQLDDLKAAHSPSAHADAPKPDAAPAH